MAKSIKLRQGTADEHAAFTGALAEVTFDTTNNTVILHDGVTAGGIPMAKFSDVPVDLTDLTDVDNNLTSGAAFSGTTYVVTVASGTNAYSTGNKYYITDEIGASPTVTLTEGETYRFDQSDSTNTGHPLKFSTTANGTHDSGSEYTTGVTYNGVPWANRCIHRNYCRSWCTYTILLLHKSQRHGRWAIGTDGFHNT